MSDEKEIIGYSASDDEEYGWCSPQPTEEAAIASAIDDHALCEGDTVYVGPLYRLTLPLGRLVERMLESAIENSEWSEGMHDAYAKVAKQDRVDELTAEVQAVLNRWVQRPDMLGGWHIVPNHKEHTVTAEEACND